ncbi:YopT-type cysteine protease domain-containing protein [Endozoicomonas gorgoniicola]|uniref:YopT-type cysteine protease domain-containing protein n=1 Tax=Endozoicomonas gorgoniicola TaxID=1234144 RepID=A0ABT3MQQ4_9GAMM|nr:YopT-type cysteine protease domain-containing protein [Endozoicomonas gorgoniicola]MCW7551703.1 YopT-type cysteine protease domain-containing protein [Endozoicomonas gorgoniicola]
MNIQDLVREFKGIPVWEFSQSSLREHYRRQGVGGLCNSLSLSWINYHAHNDSLANHLDINNQDYLVIQHAIFLQDTLQKKGPINSSMIWLQMHGMVLLNMGYGATDRPDSEYRIITTLTNEYNCYALISFGLRDYVKKTCKQHAVAAWLGGSDPIRGDACFFEPNYGEFWFESKQDFFSFFPEYYRRHRVTEGQIGVVLKDRVMMEYSDVVTCALSSKAL